MRACGIKTNTGAGAGNGEIDGTFSLAHDDSANSTLSLDNLQAGYFVQALQNLASARATNGGTVRALQYNLGNLELQITNLKAANGRIMDVDIARETANLAKQRVLVQSSASMTAQANAANDVASHAHPVITNFLRQGSRTKTITKNHNPKPHHGGLKLWESQSTPM